MGRTRTRTRLIATTAVAVSLIASLAYALTVTSGSPHTSVIPLNTAGQILFSVRNTTTSPLMVSGIQKTNPTAPFCAPYLDPTAYFSNFNDPIAPGKQQQFVATTNGVADATAQGPCSYDLHTSAGITTIAINFVAGTVHAKADLQPMDMSFAASVGNHEDQYIVVTNYQATELVGYTVQLTNPVFTFVGTCMGTSTCQPPKIGPNSYQALRVRCSPTIAGTQTGQLVVFEAGGTASTAIATTMLSCTGAAAPPKIEIADDPITIVTGLNTTGSASTTLRNSGSGTESLQGLTIVGGGTAFGFTDTVNCMNQSCTYGAGTPLPPSKEISLTCHPTTITPLTAMLTATGSNSTATAQVVCQVPAMGPVMAVTPATITADTIAVGQTVVPSPSGIKITNLGDTPLQGVTVSLTGMGSNDWTVTTSCVPPNGCTIGSNGSTMTVPIAFAPRTHGDRTATLQVHATNTAQDKFVDLLGTANGGVLVIADPIPPEINFGTLPRNQLSQHDITVANTGNSMIYVNVAASAPFVTNASGGFAVTGGTPHTFRAGCQSAVAGTFDDTITLTSNQAYAGAMQAVAVRCTVAPVDVTVTPTDYAFGELFAGSMANHKDIVITNPTSAPIDITRVALTGSRPGLSLAGEVTSTTTLAPNGGMLKATLTLDPIEETDLAGVNFEIDVQTSTLSYPVTGKVVRPHSYIAPLHLDLGTACVGTKIRGTEMLINDGTATLDVFTPVMDQGFTTMLTNPSTYPSKLAAGGHASVDVVPETSVTGALHGSLTWSDSVPNTYSVDVDLEYVSSGAALSPRALAFGTIGVNATSGEQTVTLENCGLDPVQIKVLGVSPSRGAGDVWTINRPVNYSKVLGTHDRLTINVSFSPHTPGHFDAELELEVGAPSAPGMSQTVALSGQAVGPDPVQTSFYSCGSCSGGDAPSRGWPIVLAIMLVIRRRRRVR